MGKLLLLGVSIGIIISIFYLIAFFASMILVLERLLYSAGFTLTLPLRERLIVIKNYASDVFLLVFPILVATSFITLMSLSKRRQPSSIGVIKYHPIANPKICIALTAYNDEESIYDAINDFKNQEDVAEVIVVDNNSVDNTMKRAEEAGARVVHEVKQGYGYACIRGLKECLVNKDANVIVLAEGDRTFRGYDLRKLVPYLDNADIVLGTRNTQELLDQKSQLDWFLVWGNLFLAKLIQIKYWNVKCWGRVRLTDVGCTMRAIRREALDRIIGNLKVGGNYFSPHMIMVALNDDLKVVEVPITFRERVGASKGAGGSRWRAVKIGLKMLWHILTH